jgi:hypothetical protein
MTTAQRRHIPRLNRREEEYRSANHVPLHQPLQPSLVGHVPQSWVLLAISLFPSEPRTVGQLSKVDLRSPLASTSCEHMLKDNVDWSIQHIIWPACWVASTHDYCAHDTAPTLQTTCSGQAGDPSHTAAGVITECVAAILERESGITIRSWLNFVEQSAELIRLRLDSRGPAPISKAAREHGRSGFDRATPLHRRLRLRSRTA